MNLVKPKEGFECPTRSKNRMKDHVTAVTIEEICDGTPHCPNEEDEDPTACFFYKIVSAHRFKTLISTLTATFANFIQFKVYIFKDPKFSKVHQKEFELIFFKENSFLGKF